MLLDSPALQLRLTLKDALGIVERLLKERHWRQFDIDSVSLVYVPYWFFNYDIYQEAEGAAQTFSSQMCLNAITGKLEPVLINILDSIPVERSKEVKHDVKHTVDSPVIEKAEVANVAQLKVAGQVSLPKAAVTISGINLAYAPIWKIWISLPAGSQRVELDGVSGSPLNIEAVPTKERGFMEVTQDMLEDLKTPQGWIDYSKKAFNWGMAASAGAGAGILKSGALHWLLTTRNGQYTLLATLVAILIVYLLYVKPRIG
jgi:hypothetical protein